MNPLCPRCRAHLRSATLGDALHCPSCDYTWGGTPNITIESNDDDDVRPVYLE